MSFRLISVRSVLNPLNNDQLPFPRMNTSKYKKKQAKYINVTLKRGYTRKCRRSVCEVYVGIRMFSDYI